MANNGHSDTVVARLLCATKNVSVLIHQQMENSLFQVTRFALLAQISIIIVHRRRLEERIPDERARKKPGRFAIEWQ